MTEFVPLLPVQRLDGRHAVVTGAGRGIGRAAALALAEAGASLTLFARTGDELTAVAREVAIVGQTPTRASETFGHRTTSRG